MLPADDVTTLTLLYHLNSEPWVVFDAGDLPAHEMEYKELAGIDKMVRLPQPQGETQLPDLLRRRRSCRRYLRREMPLAQLTLLLAATYGITRQEQLPDGVSFLAHAVPSAGGRYPLEVTVVAQRVSGLTDGAYHYNVLLHALEPLRGGDVFPELGGCLIDQQSLADANLVIIFSAVFHRTLARYGARGYRYILFEAGHAAQNLCLLATEQHLGSLCIGGFFDGRLNRFLHLDGRGEAALYCVVVGYPDGG